MLAERDATIALQANTIASLTAKVEVLEALVRKLVEERGRNSSNSNLPPSSDGPGGSSPKTGRTPDKKGRKRGGQPGHKGSHRVLVPAEQVHEAVEMFPARCDDCYAALPKTPDPDPTRHQYIELTPLLPHVTEFRRHEVFCSRCGHRTRAHYDDDVIPRYAFGPRVAAVATLLTGVYHLSRRSTVRLLQELLGLRISTGSVSNLEQRMSKAVEPAVDEAWAEAQTAAVKHTDGTTWLQAGVIVALWTIATAGVTVFKVLSNGQGETLERELLTSTKGVLVSDRASALKFWAMRMRQI
ncbi:MAG: hypothetical protein RL385_2982, partial [Pseudomonadota bacterium]